MKKKSRFSVWKLLKLPPQFLYAIGLGPIYDRIVLLLTTTVRVAYFLEIRINRHPKLLGTMENPTFNATNAVTINANPDFI